MYFDILNMTLTWQGSERSFGLFHFFFFTSDQNTALIERKLMAYKTLHYDFKLSQNLYFATDFDENSMASRMNSGGSIDLNRIKIDPRTGEKFSFYLDKVAATEWYGQEASRF